MNGLDDLAASVVLAFFLIACAARVMATVHVRLRNPRIDGPWTRPAPRYHRHCREH